MRTGSAIQARFKGRHASARAAARMPSSGWMPTATLGSIHAAALKNNEV